MFFGLLFLGQYNWICHLRRVLPNTHYYAVNPHSQVRIGSFLENSYELDMKYCRESLLAKSWNEFDRINLEINERPLVNLIKLPGS